MKNLSIIISLTLVTIFTLSCGQKKSSEDQKSANVESPKVSHMEAPAVLPLNGFAKKPPLGTKAWCPVMKNHFTVASNTHYTVYKGRHYAFCCPGCKPQFEKNPEKFIKMVESYKK